jgi:shikimate kinase
MNIYFSGLIGVGKTTVGKALAILLGWEFDDLDVAMERSAGKNFRLVVQDEGWLGFRMREYAIMKQFAQMDHKVIGLGGGTVRYEWNRDAIKGSGVNILLTTDISVLPERLRDNDRPRVNPGMTMEEDLAWMWEKHKDTYLGFADIVYRTDQGKTVEQEAEELLQILKKDYSVS